MISIIIPTYNRAKVLPIAVNSILEQTHEEWELIIIDDGSSDETKTVVNHYLKDSRIKYFWQSNKGVSAARNIGAEKALGDHLIFLDSDDTLDPRTLSLVHSLNISDFDLFFWNVLRTIDGREFKQQPVPLGRMYNNIKGIFLAGSFCLRKDIFLEVGKYDPEIYFGENYELGLRICQKQNLKLNYINEELLTYKINTSSRESDDPEKRLSSHLYQLEKHKNSYLNDPFRHAEMLHIIGHILDRCSRRDEALKYYFLAWKKNPLKLKPLLKLIYLRITR